MNQKICFYGRPYPWVNSFYDMIDATVQDGLSVIEASCSWELKEPDVEAAKKIRAYADSKGVTFSCFSLYANLVGPDGRKGIDRMKAYAEIAAIMGSPYLHHTIAGECMEPDNVLPKKEEYYQQGLEAVREIYDHAQKYGVRAIYEDQGYIFNGVNDFRRFLDEVGRDVGVVADFGNIYETTETIEDFIKAFPDKIVNVHLKDLTIDKEDLTGWGLKSLRGGYMNECEIGKGCVDFETCIGLLKANGYDGCYAIEFGETEDNPCMKEVLKRIDNWLK